MRKSFTFLACLLFLLSCDEKIVQDEKQDEIQSLEFVGFVLFNEYDMSLELDYVIEGAQISGDTLIVTVSFEGGYKDHEFKLICADMFVYTLPPRARTMILHESNNDPCKENLMETLFFDLSALRDGLSSPIVNSNYPKRLYFGRTCIRILI